MVIELLALLQASAVQGPAPVPTVAPPRLDYSATGAGPPPQAPLDPGLTTPAVLAPPPPVFARRSGPLCSDFTLAPGASWTAAASVEFPGPRGPVQVTQGQVVAPGDYLQGFDLGSVLQRTCPRLVAPTPRPPTG
jgi:hypothetical protein